MKNEGVGMTDSRLQCAGNFQSRATAQREKSGAERTFIILSEIGREAIFEFRIAKKKCSCSRQLLSTDLYKVSVKK